MKVKYLLLVLEVHAKEAGDFLCTEPAIKVILSFMIIWSGWFWSLWVTICDCFEIVFVILFLQILWFKWFSVLWSSKGQFWSLWQLWDFYEPPWITLGSPKAWWVGYENIIRIKISQCYFWKLPWHINQYRAEREKDIKEGYKRSLIEYCSMLVIKKKTLFIFEMNCTTLIWILGLEHVENARL